MTTCPNLILFLFKICRIVHPYLNAGWYGSITLVLWFGSDLGGCHFLLLVFYWVLFYRYLLQIICCIYIKRDATNRQLYFSSPVQGRLTDGKVIDTSLSREPLVVELGKRSVITGTRLSHLNGTRNYMMFIKTEIKQSTDFTTHHIYIYLYSCIV